MTALVCFLIGFYLMFNFPALWGWFCRLGDRERVFFGVCVFEAALFYWWFA